MCRRMILVGIGLMLLVWPAFGGCTIKRRMEQDRFPHHVLVPAAGDGRARSGLPPNTTTLRGWRKVWTLWRGTPAGHAYQQPPAAGDIG